MNRLCVQGCVRMDYAYTEIYFWFLLNKLEFDCIYHFSIGLNSPEFHLIPKQLEDDEYNLIYVYFSWIGSIFCV